MFIVNGLLLMLLGETLSQLTIAPHQIIVTQGPLLIRLTGRSSKQPLQYFVSKSENFAGSLLQLSQVFSTYGYEPKGGLSITSNNTFVTGSGNRLYYVPPSLSSLSNKVCIYNL
jgi:hypothetical protein